MANSVKSLLLALAASVGITSGAKVPEANKPSGETKEPVIPDSWRGPAKGFYGGHTGRNQRQRRKQARQAGHR